MKHAPRGIDPALARPCCRHCGLADGCPITWSNGRDCYTFCDDDCLRRWLDEEDRRVMEETRQAIEEEVRRNSGGRT
jgi:hypothetical protein